MTDPGMDPLADSIIRTDDYRTDDDDIDSEAPWGRKSDGTPYKRNPADVAESLRAAREARWPGGTAKAATSRRRSTRAPGRSSTARKPTAPAPPPYAAALMGLAQIPIGGLALAGRITGNAALSADAVTIAVHGPPLFAAVADAAVDDERLAAVLDKVTVMSGPYAKIFAAAIPFILQIVINHAGVNVPAEVTAATGVMSRADLIERFTQTEEAA